MNHKIQVQTIPRRLRILHNILFLWTGIILASEVSKISKISYLVEMYANRFAFVIWTMKF